MHYARLLVIIQFLLAFQHLQESVAVACMLLSVAPLQAECFSGVARTHGGCVGVLDSRRPFNPCTRWGGIPVSVKRYASHLSSFEELVVRQSESAEQLRGLLASPEVARVNGMRVHCGYMLLRWVRKEERLQRCSSSYGQSIAGTNRPYTISCIAVLSLSYRSACWQGSP